MANGAFKFKDNSGNVVSFISGSGSNISFSGGTLDLSGMTGLTLGNLTLSGTTQNAISASHASSYLLTSSFNTYTGTTNTLLGTLQTSTSSLNSFTSSATSRLSSIETSTGSLNTFTSSATTRLNSIEGVSGSYATTGSNQFKNDQVITGSLTVTGFIDAQELRTTYISSSILYRSGSTKFGDELSDTHAFTGSLLVSGTISVPSSGLVSSSVQVDVMSTTNIARLATTGSNTFTGNQIINATLGVGVINPSAELQVGKSSDVTIAMSNSSSVTSGNRGGIAWYNSNTSTVANIRAVAITDNVGTELQFYTRPAAGSLTQVMTLDSSGRLGIGYSSPAYQFQVLDTIGLRANSQNFQAIKGTGWGYSPTGYRVVMIGDNDPANFTTVSIGYDPSGNSNGAFNGNGREVLFRNGASFATPTSANTAFHLNTLVLKDGNVLFGTDNADVGGSVLGTVIRSNGTIAAAINMTSPANYTSPFAADRMNTAGDGVMYGMWRSGIFQAGIGATSGQVISFVTGDGSNSVQTERLKIAKDGVLTVTGPGLVINRPSDSSGEPFIFFNKNGVTRASIYGGDGTAGLRFFSDVNTFSGSVSASSLSTSGFIKANGSMKTFSAQKNFAERLSNVDFFRISGAGGSGFQVVVYSISQNGGVGWVQSQIFQASAAPYWGGWVGVSSAVDTIGSGSPIITSAVNGNDGTITFKVTTGNNGTVTDGTILSYIQVTGFNIDLITITVL